MAPPRQSPLELGKLWELVVDLVATNVGRTNT